MNQKAEIVTVEPETLPEQPVDQATAMINMIERMATDPNSDIDKFERMIALQERLLDKQAESAFTRAMNLAQSEMQPVSADAVNPQTKSKYASYAQLDKALRPIYTKNGLSLSFDEGDTDKEGYIRVLCYVSHEQGFSRTYHKDMPVVTKGIRDNVMMTQTHANASADSYGMRYLLKKIFNVAVGESDDDGNQAGQPVELVTEGMALTAQASINENNIDIGKVKAWMKKSFGTDDFNSLNVDQYPRLTHKIKETIKFQKEKS